MPSARQMVLDSDDDDDDLSPLSSPIVSPRLSAEQPLEETSQPELPELREVSRLPQLPLATDPADTSASTDPLFFRDVYEEQQRALGAQLLATSNDHDESQHAATAGAAVSTESSEAAKTSERDLWEVPSSPVEVVGQQRESYLKRKRGEEPQRNNTSVVLQLNDISSGSDRPVPKQRRTAGMSGSSSLGQLRMGLEISIPLEPLTPGMMHEYPHLTSSNIDNSISVAYDGSLPLLRTAPTLETPYNDAAQNDAVTQSTIAFTTPSVYASSGRRTLASSNNNNNNNNSNQRQSKSSNDMDIIQENGTVPEGITTPPRRARKAADLAQIMSSPDIIAEPTREAEPSHQRSPIVEEEQGADAEWEAQAVHHEKDTSNPSHRQPRRKASVEDELSIRIDVPAQSEIMHEIAEIDESDASYASPPTKTAPKTKGKTLKSKAIFIAASDDEGDDEGDEGIDDVALPPVDDSESDFSDASARPTSKAKSKKEPKVKKEQKKTEAAVDSEAKPKRSRGRPKKSEQKVQEEDKVDPENYEVAKSAQVQTKGKRGKKSEKGGRGRKSATTNTDAASIEIAIDATVLSKTSGNVSLQSSFKGTVDGEENYEGNDRGKLDEAAPNEKPDEKDEKDEKEKDQLAHNKPAPAPAGLSSGVLSTGLNTTSQGRVPYRVGLSKNFRVAPLLKVIRK